MKRISTLLTIAIFILSSCVTVTAGSKLDGYRQQARQIEKQNKIVAVDTAKLTTKQITHRKGTVLVERIIGVVKNSRKDGKILNVPKGETYYNYISYRDVSCKKGDVIVTYCLYNPESNGEDDIIARWDYKLKK